MAGREGKRLSPFKRNINIDLVRPEKASTLVGGVKRDKILLVLNEFRYGVKGERSLKDS